MTHYATCFNCATDKSACPRRLALQASLKGNAVTSLKFRCPERKAFFAPGQRISFTWSLWENQDEYEPDEMELVFHGTVIRERGTKFVVQVDAGKDASDEGIEASDVFKKNDALLIKVRPAHMSALDEPPKVVCLTCFHVEGRAENRCYRSGSSWVPKGCIIPPAVQPQKEYEF